MPTILKCPSCGAPFKSIDTSKASVECTYCGTVAAVPDSMRPKSSHSPQQVQISIQSGGTSGVRHSGSGGIVAIALVGLIILIGGAVAATVIPAVGRTASSIVMSVSTQVQVRSTLAVSVALSSSTSTPIPSPTVASAGQVALSFGGKGTGQGKFDDGRAIAVDQDGWVYVADYTTGRVQSFDATGKYQQTYQISSEIKNAPVRCLGIDRKNILYACRGGDLVKLNAESGEAMGKIEDPQGGYLDAMAVMPDGNLAVLTSSAGKDDLIVFSPQGKILKRYPKIVSSLTESSQTNLSIGVDGLGNFFILSMREKAVFRFNAEGKYLDRFGQEGSSDKDFSGAIYALALDSQGRVFVSDSRRIHIFSPDGTYLDLVRFEGGVPMDMEFNRDDELLMTANDQMVYQIRLNKSSR